MDAVHVVGQDVLLRNVARQADRGSFAMATAAQPRNLHGGNGGARAGSAQDVVRAVTVAAGGRQPVAAGRRPPVKAGGVLRLLVAMACAAIHARQFFGVRKLLLGKLAVTGRALQRRMRRSAQSRRVKRRWHPFFALTRALPGIVAGNTFFGARQGIGLLGQRGRCQHPARDQA